MFLQGHKRVGSELNLLQSFGKLQSVDIEKWRQIDYLWGFRMKPVNSDYAFESEILCL